MPAILPREIWAAWLGETGASLEEVKALLRTFDDGGTWTMTEQQPSKAALAMSAAPKPKAQPDLF